MRSLHRFSIAPNDLFALSAADELLPSESRLTALGLQMAGRGARGGALIEKLTSPYLLGLPCGVYVNRECVAVSLLSLWDTR